MASPSAPEIKEKESDSSSSSVNPESTSNISSQSKDNKVDHQGQQQKEDGNDSSNPIPHIQQTADKDQGSNQNQPSIGKKNQPQVAEKDGKTKEDGEQDRERQVQLDAAAKEEERNTDSKEKSKESNVLKEDRDQKAKLENADKEIESGSGEKDGEKQAENEIEIEKSQKVQQDGDHSRSSPPAASSDSLKDSQDSKSIVEQDSNTTVGSDKSEKEVATQNQKTEATSQDQDQVKQTTTEADTETVSKYTGDSVNAKGEEGMKDGSSKSDPSSTSTSATASNTSTIASTTPSSNPTTSTSRSDANERITIVLKLNQELIRMCINLQTEGKGGQEIFNDATSRLQSNLSYLASVADQFNPNSKRRPGSSLPRLDPFPSDSLPPESSLVELYASLSEIFSSEVAFQNGLKSTTTSDGRKREREESGAGEESRKKQSSDDYQKAAASTNSDSPSAMNHASYPNQPTSNPSSDPFQSVSSPLNNLLASAPTPPNPPTPVQSNTIAANLANSQPAPHQQQPYQQQATHHQQQQQAQVGNTLSAQNAQSLVNAYGPNAMGYLQALQSHARGLAHPFVSYMESNVPGFKGASVQTQLQQMIVAQERLRQRQAQAQAATSSSQSHSQSPIQQPSPMGMSMHNRSSSIGGSPAPQGSPISRLPMQQGGGINPSDLIGNPNGGGGPGSSAGSPAFSHSNLSRPGTAGLHQDGSRPSTPAMVGTPGSSGSFTPGAGHASSNLGINRNNHARQGSINHESPMMMNGFPNQNHHDSHQGFQQQQQQQQQAQQASYQNFNPQAMLGGANFSNQNGMGNQNSFGQQQQQQQRQFVNNNIQSLPPHLQQQMLQQMGSMNPSNGNFQGMNGIMNPNAGIGAPPGVDMNSIMASYSSSSSQFQQSQNQNMSQWNSNGR